MAFAKEIRQEFENVNTRLDGLLEPVPFEKAKPFQRDFLTASTVSPKKFTGKKGEFTIDLQSFHGFIPSWISYWCIRPHELWIKMTEDDDYELFDAFVQPLPQYIPNHQEWVGIRINPLLYRAELYYYGNARLEFEGRSGTAGSYVLDASIPTGGTSTITYNPYLPASGITDNSGTLNYGIPTATRPRTITASVNVPRFVSGWELDTFKKNTATIRVNANGGGTRELSRGQTITRDIYNLYTIVLTGTAGDLFALEVW